MVMSYLVLGRCSCSNESNAPCSCVSDSISVHRGRRTHPFAVDGHLSVRVDTEMGYLWDVSHTLHVRRVAAGTEDTGNLGLGIYVV